MLDLEPIVNSYVAGRYEQDMAALAQNYQNALLNIKNTYEGDIINYVNQAQTYANNANTKATKAKNSATAAATSEANAKTYMNNAKTYMNNAQTYANNANTQATKAKNSATAAATSEAHARTYMNAASVSANAADQSATGSANFASQAAEHARSARTYMNNAKTYADQAINAQGNLSDSVAQAKEYAKQAKQSKAAAASSAEEARGYATEAATQASSAASSAASASQKASESETYAANSNFAYQGAAIEAAKAKEYADHAFETTPEGYEDLVNRVNNLNQNGVNLFDNMFNQGGITNPSAMTLVHSRYRLHLSPGTYTFSMSPDRNFHSYSWYQYNSREATEYSRWHEFTAQSETVVITQEQWMVFVLKGDASGTTVITPNGIVGGLMVSVGNHVGAYSPTPAEYTLEQLSSWNDASQIKSELTGTVNDTANDLTLYGLRALFNTRKGVTFTKGMNVPVVVRGLYLLITFHAASNASSGVYFFRGGNAAVYAIKSAPNISVTVNASTNTVKFDVTGTASPSGYLVPIFLP